MTPEEIKRICRRAMDEAFGQRDLAAIDELFAPEVAEHAKAGSKYWHTVTPDIRYAVEDVIVEGAKAAVFWTAVGTHVGELWGVAPTQKKAVDVGGTTLPHRRRQDRGAATLVGQAG